MLICTRCNQSAVATWNGICGNCLTAENESNPPHALCPFCNSYMVKFPKLAIYTPSHEHPDERYQVEVWNETRARGHSYLVSKKGESRTFLVSAANIKLVEDTPKKVLVKGEEVVK